MKNYILGVDGGGTKSHLVIFDRNGICAGATAYGALNHEVMEGSYAELEERLLEVIPRALKDAGVSADDIAFAVLGIAGVDTRAQTEIVSAIVQKTGIEDFIVCNDAMLGVPAGSPDCTGICAIGGTGFKIAAIDYSGAAVDTCGFGGYTDDRGGGSWFGLRACAEVYNEIYRLGRPTLMRDMVFSLLGITEKEDYVETVVEKTYGDGTLYNNLELNCIAFRAAALGDAVALDILSESARQYAGAIARLAMDMDFPADKVLNVILAGSVFIKQEVKILPEMIEKLVAEVFEEHLALMYQGCQGNCQGDGGLSTRWVNYAYLQAPPVLGAVIWAAKKAGFAFEPGLVEEGLKKYL